MGPCDDNVVCRKRLHAAKMEVVVRQNVVPVTEEPLLKPYHQKVGGKFSRPLESPVNVIRPHIQHRAFSSL